MPQEDRRAGQLVAVQWLPLQAAASLFAIPEQGMPLIVRTPQTYLLQASTMQLPSLAAPMLLAGPSPSIQKVSVPLQADALGLQLHWGEKNSLEKVLHDHPSAHVPMYAS